MAKDIVPQESGIAKAQEGAALPKPATMPALHAGGAPAHPSRPKAAEIGGPKGPEPTRYGDWERAGRCVDF
jgi:hypothetical protein